jgi:hypothetical protein
MAEATRGYSLKIVDARSFAGGIVHPCASRLRLNRAVFSSVRPLPIRRADRLAL